MGGNITDIPQNANEEERKLLIQGCAREAFAAKIEALKKTNKKVIEESEQEYSKIMESSEAPEEKVFQLNYNLLHGAVVKKVKIGSEEYDLRVLKKLNSGGNLETEYDFENRQPMFVVKIGEGFFRCSQELGIDGDLEVVRGNSVEISEGFSAELVEVVGYPSF